MNNKTNFLGNVVSENSFYVFFWDWKSTPCKKVIVKKGVSKEDAFSYQSKQHAIDGIDYYVQSVEISAINE